MNEPKRASNSRITVWSYLSTLHPPKGLGSMTNLKDYVDNPDMKEWKQMLDLLWSDPKCQVGCIPNVYRGGGSYFGPDVTQRILQKYNLQMIIRSHECKIEGYEYTHNDKVLTLFSASNYYDFGSNRGAYAKLQGPNLECHIVQYQSSLQQGKKTSFTQRISALEVSAIDDLREKILGRKGKLMTEFCKYDTENTGKIKMNDWHFVMETVLEMDLPWRTLRPKLAICENDFVLYESTFEQKCIKHRYAENGPTLTEMLYRQRENLEVIFRLLDKDNSGCISMPEFQEALSILIQHQEINIKQEELADLALSLDINKDGCIDFNEFLEAFRIVDKFGQEKKDKKTSLHELIAEGNMEIT